MCLSIDQAFDRVDHAFLQRVLDKFGFGPNFRKWIETLYSDRTAHFLNDGFRTLAVRLKRGLLQGCPLSFILYVLIAQVLSASIRSNDQINGFELPVCTASKKQKVPKLLTSSYADDTTLFLNPGKGSINSLHNIFHLFSIYEKATGAKFNESKTTATFFGPGHFGYITDLFQLNWKDAEGEGIKILGITWYKDAGKT